MTQAQASYELLLMLAAIDGHVVDIEKQVMRHYVKSTYPGESLDFAALEEQLVQLADAEAITARFMVVAQLLQAELGPDERRRLLSQALDVIMADGVITNEESVIFRSLANLWAVDLAPLLASHL